MSRAKKKPEEHGTNTRGSAPVADHRGGVVKENPANTDVAAYPCLLGVFCDRCGVTFEGDFLVAEDWTQTQRLDCVRAHVREKLGWVCDARGDFCPNCRESAPTAAVVAFLAGLVYSLRKAGWSDKEVTGFCEDRLGSGMTLPEDAERLAWSACMHDDKFASLNSDEILEVIRRTLKAIASAAPVSRSGTGTDGTIATPVRVYRSETTFAVYRTPGPDALFEAYNADAGEWQPTRWESLEALAGKCGPMTEVEL